jgi:anaphase-promoting complex subunit 6
MFAIGLHVKSGSPILAWPWISQSDIDCPYIRHERGVVCFLEGDIAVAARDFEFVIQGTTDQDLIGAAALNLGHCWRRMEDFAKAVKSYELVLSCDMKVNEALAAIGFTYHLMDRRDEAILYYNRCLAVDPVHHFAAKMVGIAIGGG